jgi:hypothetical protein
MAAAAAWVFVLPVAVVIAAQVLFQNSLGEGIALLVGLGAAVVVLIPAWLWLRQPGTFGPTPGQGIGRACSPSGSAPNTAPRDREEVQS